MRLNRYLAACGLGSRRQCEVLITAGRVRVNGEVGQLGTRVGQDDLVTLDRTRVTPPDRYFVWMLHKPAGVVCTADDPQGRATVLDLAQRHGVQERVFSIGRLDLDTTGLLLLTNDGKLSHRLTHPSMGVEKEYEADVSQPLSDATLERLRGGVELEDGRSAPCDARQEQRGARCIVRLVLHEGRKRQVRRMLAMVGHPVLKLHRVRVGHLRLGSLQEGQLRRLDADETRRLLEGAPRNNDTLGQIDAS